MYMHLPNSGLYGLKVYLRVRPWLLAILIDTGLSSYVGRLDLFLSGEEYGRGIVLELYWILFGPTQ